jgi:hypothetical protein
MQISQLHDQKLIISGPRSQLKKIENNIKEVQKQINEKIGEV